MRDLVEDAWGSGSYRMEVWMTGERCTAVVAFEDEDILAVGEAAGLVRLLDDRTRGTPASYTPACFASSRN